jgi:hypothetical protein
VLVGDAESREKYVFVLLLLLTQNEWSEWGFCNLLLKKKPFRSQAF